MHFDLDAVQLSQFSKAETAERQLSDEEQAQLSALGDRYDELVAALEDGDESLTAEIDRVTDEIARLEDSRGHGPAKRKRGQERSSASDPTGRWKWCAACSEAMLQKRRIKPKAAP